MHVAVCLAPIIDPKLPDVRLALHGDGLGVAAADAQKMLGPFDAAALETALKIRDRDPGASVVVLLVAGADDRDAVQDVLSRRIDEVVRVEPGELEAWDMAAAARRLGLVLAALDPRPDLVLTGREFGDRDDGVVPVLLAERLGWPFVGHVHAVGRDGGDLVLARTRDAVEEEWRMPPPVVVSVTNHPSNRLRYPLPKDVMAARRKAARAAVPDDSAPVRQVTPIRLALRSHQERRSGACRMLTGAAEVQAEELARVLAPWKAVP